MLSGMPSGSMNYGIIHAMYYDLIVPSMCWRCLALDAYKEGILCESVLVRGVRVCESEVTRRREKEELLPWAAALLPYAAECVSWELSDPPPCIYCNPFSISNTMALSRGCRRFCRTT